MLRSTVRFVVAAFVLALSLPPQALAEGSVTLAPLGLPNAKPAMQELKYAFGKDWENGVRAEVKANLAATKLFSDVVPEGGDLTFTLDLREIKRTFDDRVKLSGKGTLVFTGSGTFSWKRGETVVGEGSFSLTHSAMIDHEPWRADLSEGWREILRQAVQEAVDKGHAAGVFSAP